MKSMFNRGITDIFVFGSNCAGRHGSGAAKFARTHYGAIYGQGEGLQGKSYAIPTKDDRLRSLSLENIASAVKRFDDFSLDNPQYHFLVTKIGCGLAGYNVKKIAPLFENIEQPNVFYPQEFIDFFGWHNYDQMSFDKNNVKVKL